MVHNDFNNHSLSDVFNQPKSCDVATGFRSLPDTSWDDLLLAPMESEADTEDLDRLFSWWQPLIAIVAFPFALARAQWKQFLPSQVSNYNIKSYTIRHASIGGVTQTRWRFTHLSRLDQEVPKETGMMARTYVGNLFKHLWMTQWEHPPLGFSLSPILFLRSVEYAVVELLSGTRIKVDKTFFCHKGVIVFIGYIAS